MSSFSLYYYVFLPIKLWFEDLDLMFFCSYMLPIIFRGRSLVMLTEDLYYEMNSGVLHFRYRIAYKIFGGWAAKHATRIMAISENSKREVAKLFKIDPERISVNQLGVDPARKVTGHWPLATDHYILYVGQAFPRRHLRETMLAFEKIVPDCETVARLGLVKPLQGRALQLIAVGKDKYNPPIIEKLKNDINRNLGRDAIIHKDYVSEDELAGLYANARCVIYVSSKEAFGLPPLEALGYGVPAVVADAKVSHEIFGDNAFFATEPDSPESIATAISDTLTNREKREKIKNAASGILDKYTWGKHTDRFLEIIRN